MLIIFLYFWKWWFTCGFFYTLAFQIGNDLKGAELWYHMAGWMTWCKIMEAGNEKSPETLLPEGRDIAIIWPGFKLWAIKFTPEPNENIFTTFFGMYDRVPSMNFSLKSWEQLAPAVHSCLEQHDSWQHLPWHIWIALSGHYIQI